MVCFRGRYYGIRLLHIFEIPSISKEKPRIFIKIPSISIEHSISIEILGIWDQKI